MNQQLINQLTEATQILREEYLAKTEIYAKEHFAFCKERLDWGCEEWCKFLGIEPKVTLVANGTSSPYLTEDMEGVTKKVDWPYNFYNTRNARTVSDLKNKYRMVVGYNKPVEEYIASELKYAELHYKMSIEKLATRIEAKGLNQENLQMETGRVGVNIETTITDGEKTVKAWTIIAEGPIQRPHYRYLVK